MVRTMPTPFVVATMNTFPVYPPTGKAALVSCFAADIRAFSNRYLYAGWFSTAQHFHIHFLTDHFPCKPNQQLLVRFDWISSQSDQDIPHHQAAFSCRAIFFQSHDQQTVVLFSIERLHRIRRQLHGLAADAEVAAFDRTVLLEHLSNF